MLEKEGVKSGESSQKTTFSRLGVIRLDLIAQKAFDSKIIPHAIKSALAGKEPKGYRAEVQ